MAYNLALVSDINTMVDQINNKKFDIAPEKWYDQMLLDTIKLGNENYVHLKYAETKEFPAGYQSMTLRRWGGLTAHTEPLKEGIPPISDMTAMDSIQVAAMAFGRYMEFTDRVNLDQLDPQIMHYTKELADVAVRTLERYARKEMLASASKFYANSRANAGDLVFGDKLNIADIRFLQLRMKRLMVQPLNGYFDIICSPEILHDFFDDQLVQEYLKLEQNGSPYVTGKPVELFQTRYVETMLDEYYTELDHPGEWYGVATEKSTDPAKYYLRVYLADVDANGKITGYKYVNIPADAKIADNVTKVRTVVTNTYLSDGSAIPVRVKWNIQGWLDANNTKTVKGTVHTLADNKVLYNQDIVIDKTKLWQQLPIHKALMIGKDALIKTGISGQSGAKTYVKPLGSTGVLDPIDQRQSIGFKINSVGFTLLRDESCQVLYCVPTQAAVTANIMRDETPFVKTFGEKITAGAWDALKQNPLYKNDEDGARGDLLNDFYGDTTEANK